MNELVFFTVGFVATLAFVCIAEAVRSNRLALK